MVQIHAPELNPNRAPSEKRVEIGRLRELGLSYVDIGRKLGLSKATVAYHARRANSPD